MQFFKISYFLFFTNFYQKKYSVSVLRRWRIGVLPSRLRCGREFRELRCCPELLPDITAGRNGPLAIKNSLCLEHSLIFLRENHFFTKVVDIPQGSSLPL